MRITTVVAALLMSLLPLVVAAAEPDGSHDHPLVGRVTGSTIYEFKEQNAQYTVPLGKLVEDYKLDKSQVVTGNITHLMYEGPKGKKADEVAKAYEDLLKSKGFEILYDCAHDGCGMGFFKFHPDREDGWNDTKTQHHITAKLSRPEGDVWASIHVEDAYEGGIAFIDADFIDAAATTAQK